MDEQKPSPVERLPRKSKSRLFRVIRAGVLVYVVALVLLMLFENLLVYPAPKYDAETWEMLREQAGAEEIAIENASGAPVTAWLVEPRTVTDRKRFAIYFHGNGENIAYNADFLRRFSDEMETILLAVEYPGYDHLGERPSEQGICRNAKAGLDWLCTRFTIDATDVIVMGRSLGGGPAMFLADGGNTRGIILLSTFSTLPDVAADKYSIFPVKRVMRNQFPSVERMRSCKQPLLQFHGDVDRVIPLKFARTLFAASPSNSKRFYELRGYGHNYRCPDEFWAESKSFIESLD